MMGMFDYLKCEMPLPQGAQNVREWQTKDLECFLVRYAIRADGQLVDECKRNEIKPGAPPEPPLGEWASRSAWKDAWLEWKIGPDKPINYTGAVNFYGDDDKGEWWSFCAFIEKGRCTKILQLEPVD